MSDAGPTVSVVIITYVRPDFVRQCLDHLLAQTRPAEQIVVVDASPDDATEKLVAGYQEVSYLRNHAGAGNMTNSRNAALRVVTGDVIAFLDDDAFPEPDYLQQLAAAYEDPSVGLACCRTLNGQPGEDTDGVDEIGKFRPDGTLTGNFAADPGSTIDIDHGIGATMSFRWEVLYELGFFREDYRGISGVREDADVFLRSRERGHRAVFIPAAVARHVAAPQARGQRFDLRYHHWIHRNHTILLINNFGLTSPTLWRFAYRSPVQDLHSDRSLLSRVARAILAFAGVLRGTGYWLIRYRGRRPPAIGADSLSTEIRAAMQATHISPQRGRSAGDAS